jgi:hypothetical protein
MSGCVPGRCAAAGFAAASNWKLRADPEFPAGPRRPVQPLERAAATKSSPARPPAGRSPAIARRPQAASPGPCGDLRKRQQCPSCSWFEPTPTKPGSLSVGSTDLGQVRSLWPSVLSVRDRLLEGFQGAATPALRFNSAGGTAAVPGCGDTPNWPASRCEKCAAKKKFLLPQRILSARRASNQLLHDTWPIRSGQQVQRGERCHCARRVWPGKHDQNFLKHLSRNCVQ